MSQLLKLVLIAAMLTTPNANRAAQADEIAATAAATPAPTDSTRSHTDTLPATDWTVRVWMHTPEGVQAIHGHFPAPNPQDGGRIDLFTRPTLVFVPHNSNPADIPSAVHEMYSKDGYTFLTFKLQVSSPEVRQLAAETLLREQKSYLEKRNKKNPNDVLVERWPLVHLVLRFFDHRDNKLIAQSETSSLVRSGDQIEIKVPFTDKNLELFLDAAAAKSVRVIPFYTYRNRQVAVSAKHTQMAAEVQTKVANELRSERTTANGPLFQAQVQRVISQSKFTVETAITASASQLLPFMGDSNAYIGKLLDVYDKPLNELTKDELRALIAHAQPLVDTFNEIEGLNVTLTEGHEDESSNIDRKKHINESSVTTTLSGETGAKATVGVAEFGAKARLEKQWRKSNSNISEQERTNRALDMFQKSTGITLQKGKLKNEYVPSKIRIFYVKDGAANASFSESTTYAVGIGVEHSYLEDSPFFLHWTTDVIEFSTSDQVDGL